MDASIFLNEVVDGYLIDRICGSGYIGSVCHASRKDIVTDERAVKFIKLSSIRETWQNEINKVTRLGTTQGVVPFITYGDIAIKGDNFRWMAWKYISGKSLREITEDRSLTMPIVYDVVRVTLGVLHACQTVGTEHGDLHAGNIIIEDPNELNIDPEFQRVWVTDFGYLSNSSGKEILDDFLGFSLVLEKCLGCIDFHALEGRDKYVYTYLKSEFRKKLIEVNPLEGRYVRNPRELLKEFEVVLQGAASPELIREQHVGDYLAAEIIGNRFNEWQQLFVPTFVGAEKLLSRNIAVLTGLRGCGKTTIFRRLTALYDVKLGPSRVPRANEFLGFYLNARMLAEAFPWLPREKLPIAKPRVLHFFNCCWAIEIIDWLWEIEKQDLTFSWLVHFFKKIFGADLLVTGSSDAGLHHLRSFLAKQRDHARLTTGYEGETTWQLDRIDFLETLVESCQENINASKGLPFYFWLDDYSTPLVTSELQGILNAIVFKRSSNVIFKVATESIESIELVGLHGKLLEQDDDFVLVDMGTEVIQRSRDENQDIILQLITPRLLRDKVISSKNLSMQNLLGKTPYSYNDLARRLKKDEANPKERVRYHGLETFSDLWSSSTRELIILFAEMVEVGRKRIEQFNKDVDKPPIIREDDQDRLMRNAGSRFRSLLAAATNPTKKIYEITGPDRSFGEHLQKIVDAFCDVADHELQTKTSKNEGGRPPKQAIRIEITNTDCDIPDDLLPYYKAIIRYGVFIRDYRGKSARGKAVPRLVLRSILIPYYTLTFSKRDSIMMSWKEFCDFMSDPQSFAAMKKKETKQENPNLMLPGM